ncbi:MAG: S24 family peptidase [Hyphomicrobium sp.]|nr:S24 family peptidase [Hyphomicrobium sp.]
MGDGSSTIPRFAPDASGSAVHQPADADTLAVHKDFFSAHRLDPQRTGIVRVVGDAMSPDLNDGALVIIDMRPANFTDEGIWVLGRPGASLVRRLVFKGDAAHRIAINKAYDDTVIKGGEQTSLKIWGRVALVLSAR